MHSIDDLISAKEVLRITGQTDHTIVTRWVQQGRLTPARTLNESKRSVRLFWRQDAERLADELRHDLEERLARIDAGRSAS